jgi:translation elongation factor EF-G
MAFEIAGRAATREEFEKRPRNDLMEPLVQVDITTPEEYMGDILGRHQLSWIGRRTR